MPSQYNGIPGNITRPNVQAIVSSTNASPIKLQVTGHGLITGDVVDVMQHQTNTAANGRWAVTVVDANNFLLVGSTGNGVGGATGQILPRTFGASYAIPSDGDARNAASVDVALEALGDRTALLNKNASGGYGLVYESAATLTGASLATVWGSLLTTSSYVQIPNALWSISDINYNDVVDWSLDSTYEVVSASDQAMAWYTNLCGAGASPGSYTQLPGSQQVVAATVPTAFSKSGRIVCSAFPAGLNGGTLNIGLWAAYASGAQTLDLVADYFFRYRVWRLQ